MHVSRLGLELPMGYRRAKTALPEADPKRLCLVLGLPLFYKDCSHIISCRILASLHYMPLGSRIRATRSRVHEASLKEQVRGGDPTGL